MAVFDPKEMATAMFHSIMLGTIAPRPIAFVSTVDKQGNVNLSPYSFFNAFGSNPATLIFAPARRVRDNTTKHTYENVKEVPEAVVNIVSYDMVQQMSLASTEYPKGVNEFIKSGFEPVASSRVKPPRVGVSKAAFECNVKQVIELGQDGGAGNLIICEILLAHISDEILDEKMQIDPFKLDAVGRLGGDWYVRVNGDALFEVVKPVRNLGIGVDQLPENIRLSSILTGNDLGKLGNTEILPLREELMKFREKEDIKERFEKISSLKDGQDKALHQWAKEYLDQDEVMMAWNVLLSSM